MSTIKTKKSPLDEKVGKAVVNIVKSVNEDAENANLNFQSRSKLTDGFQSEVEIRDFTFISDEPEELGGTDKGPNPVEYVLGALAACQEIVVKAHAVALGIDVKSVEVEVDGDLDLHGFLNLSETRPGFTKVRYHTKIKTEETDAKKLEQLKKISIKNCPVLDIIENPAPVDGKVSYIN
jgi:uncharacterized OsmC-like protein